MKNKIVISFISVIFVALIFTVFYFYNSHKNNSENEIENIENSTQYQTENNVSENKDNESNSEIYTKLNDLKTSVCNFYENKKDSYDFYSIYGLLHIDKGDGNKIEVTPKILKEEGFYELSPDLTDAFFVYINVNDFSEFIGETNDKNELEIFTVSEYDYGYAVVPKEGVGFTVDKSKFADILLKYNLVHGEMRNPKIDSNDYKQIINAANNYNSVFSSYWGMKDSKIITRYMACDDLYAVAVLSIDGYPEDIKEYAFVYDNSWKVLKEGLERFKTPSAEINKICPDFNLGLLPDYSIYNYKSVIKSDYNDIVNMLLQNNIINKEDLPVIYSCGTDKVLYIEFNSGKKLVGGADSNGELSCNYVNNNKEAESYLKRFTDNVPSFIFKYDVK